MLFSRRTQQCYWIALLLLLYRSCFMSVGVVEGFITTTTTTRFLHSKRTPPFTSSRRNMMTPDQVHDILVHSTNTMMTTTDHTSIIPSVLSTSTQWLADSGAAAAAAAQDEGWWNSYINIFKTALLFVHSTIDGPLRSVGIEQTWGISIAIFTASIRSLLVPLSLQQSKSAEYMKALKPYMADIKEKYKDNEKLQNQAIGKLYEDANQNPLAGCLLSLAQIPVFLGLYRGVRLLAMDNALQEPFLWIPSLEGPVKPPLYRGLDWLTQGWTANPDGGAIPIPPMGWETTIAFLIMPVVLVVLQSITMQVLQPPVDENASETEKEQMASTQNALKFLPLLIGFFSLQVPAGLTIYWFTSNIFTLTQSLAARAYYAANPPKIELPDYWDALSNAPEDLTPEERRKASQAGLRVGPTFADLVDEARFHAYIERSTPLRTETAAWKRVAEQHNKGSSGVDLPSELEAWVKSSRSEPAAAKTEATA